MLISYNQVQDKSQQRLISVGLVQDKSQQRLIGTVLGASSASKKLVSELAEVEYIYLLSTGAKLVKICKVVSLTPPFI